MSDDEAVRSEAARALGRARTPKKAESSRGNLEDGRKKRWADPAARERQAQAIREAARLRREAKQISHCTYVK